MRAVFYDLETSDKNPIGQIINYCFIFVDDRLETIDELSGLVKLSRLQLPDSGAILANRTDIVKHQKEAHDHEEEAMRKIATFLESCIARSGGAISFLGYNSSRFDLNYLRTSLIRNGVNPYFNNQLLPRDLLQSVQKAYLCSNKFRELILKSRAGEKRLSLSLETVGHALGLLDGAQAHESREDVVLTIRVAEWLRRECGIDPVIHEPYEGLQLHSTARSGSVYFLEQPEYDLDVGDFCARTPVTLLDANHKAGLWVDLERYASKQSPECIMWRSAAKHPFFVPPRASNDPDLQRLARAAMTQFKAITLKNFFKPSTCDVEADIYRLDFDNLAVYINAIKANDKKLLEQCTKPEAKILWARRMLASPRAKIEDPKTAETLKKYALYRYGGKLQLARSVSEKEDDKDSGFHTSLSEMVQQLMRSREAAVLTRNEEDQRLLDSLESYIRSSDIVKVAGNELLPHWFGGSSAAVLVE
jgi:hypothetical protein